MKKRLSFVAFSAVLLAFSLVFGTLVNNEYVKADAGTRATLVVNDKFNDSKYKNSYDSSKWIAVGNNIKQSGTADSYLQNNGCQGGRLFFGTRDILQEIEYFQLDLKFGSKGRWFGIKFLKEQVTEESFTESYADFSMYEAPIMVYDDKISVLDISYQHPVSLSGPTSFSSSLGISSITNTWITLKFVPSSSTSMRLYIKLAEAANFDSYIDVTTTSSLYDFYNGQFGIQTENDSVVLAVDNFKIKSKNVTLEEEFLDFDETDETYPLVNIRNIYRNVSMTDGYLLFGNSKMMVNAGTSKGERLMALKPASLDDSSILSVEVINAKFRVKIDSAATGNEAIAFVFGLPHADSNLNEAGGYFIIGKINGTLAVSSHLFIDGSDIETHKNTNVPTLSSTEGAEIEISINKDGTAILNVNGVSKTYIQPSNAHPDYKVTSYSGFMGFEAMENITHEISLDDAYFKSATYFVPYTKSVTHNFSNDFFGNEGHEDFYIPVNHSGKVEVVDGKLKLSGVADDVIFGSAYQYDCFILEYKLCSIYVGTPDKTKEEKTDLYRWVGLDLSRKSKTISYYGSYAMLNVSITPDDETEYVYCNIWQHPNSDSTLNVYEDVKIQRYTPIPASLFRDIQYDGVNTFANSIPESDYVCFKWVSYGDSIELYLKKASEPDYTKITKFSNLELNGYFGLCTTGYLYCEYDDFSMANTSPVYTCADNEAPETITETEVVTIYDPGNVDTNWEDEVNINLAGSSSSNGCGGSIVATSAILSIISLIGIGLLVIKKKGE